MISSIFPLQFARAIQQALAYRHAGMSQVEAVTQACRTVEISTDWALVVQLVLEGGSLIAEDWCERIYKDDLDRARTKEGAFH